MSRKQRTWGLGLSFALIALIAVAGVMPSGKSPRLRLSRESTEPDRDHPTRRQAWFMAGRQALGQNTAALRQRAFQQLQEMRRASAARLSSVRRGSPNNTSPVAWANLGPTNLASDTTGSQSYGAVTGRATSVAIDQGDTSGNTVFIGGAFGGVWKSTNAAGAPGSVVWTPVVENSNLSFTDSIGAIAIEPGTTGSSAVVLVGTGEPNSTVDSYYGNGILRSADGGNSWTQITSSSDVTPHTFFGLGFSKITFSTKTTTQVVAAAGATDFAFTETATQGSAIIRGPYFSTDAGATWKVASVTDSGSAITPGSTTDIAFNPTVGGANGTFYALIRNHGMYSSTDGGATWTRMASQPQGTTPMDLTHCPTILSSSAPPCPLYRGHIAVKVIDATHSEVYVAYVDGALPTQNIAGVFRSVDGGANWTNLGTTGYISCADSFGCGTSQADYNMYLTAVPNGSNTDLYFGGINVYRCVSANANPTCTWQNLTHAYGCSPTAAPSNVHPDQHGFDFLHTNTNTPGVMYFANDGGIYRSMDGAAVDGSCTAGMAAHWQNLNGTLGPMTEFVSFSQDVNNAGIFVGGTQDNGSPSDDGSGNWNDANNGDGGFSAIDPTNSNIWYTSNTDVSVQRCDPSTRPPGAPATSCRFAQFPLIVDDIPVKDGGNNNMPDASSFYTPFMLDPRDPTKVIIATCRVWRGSSSDHTLWPGTANANALSFNFDSNFAPATTCASSNTMISALAAGGPAAPSGSAAVIYAGREDGQIFVSTSAESGPSSFVNRSIAAATGGCPASGASLTGGCRISSIAVDTLDASGKTAVATVMGFGISHVWRTIDGGANWTDIDLGNLPNSPANSVVIDPFDSTHMFVGSDIGVFETTNTGTSWSAFGTGMPSVPTTRLLLFDAGGNRELRASTYGRGIWHAALPAVAFFFQAPSGTSATIAAGQTANYSLNISSAGGFAGPVTFACSGAPGGSTCTVNNGNPITLTATSSNVSVPVSVTNTQNAGVRPPQLRGWPLLVAAILAGVMIGASRKPKQAFPMVLAVLMIGGMLSCGGGGGSSPTPTPTPKPNTIATLTVTGSATSPAVSHGIQLSLTVTH